jgi:hypothetical protein
MITPVHPASDPPVATAIGIIQNSHIDEGAVGNE